MWAKKKEELHCEFGQYEEIWGDHRGNCKRIIRITANYIVLIDKNKNIDWETTEVYDASRSMEDKKRFEKMLSQCSIAEHMPTGGLSEVSVLSFKTIVGEAVVNCLESNYEGAAEILARADTFRLDRVVEKSREWYLSCTVLLTAILIAIAMILNLRNPSLCDPIMRIINVGSWAIAGACLSIILRSGRLQHASYAGKYLHCIESGCRLVGGFITGQIVYLGIKSGVLFSNIVVEGNAQYIIPFLALLAGASERFAPSIITKVESSASISDSVKEN